MGSLVRAVARGTCVLQLQTGLRMLSLRSCLMCCLVLLMLLQPTPAPFPPGDPRAFLNPFIEPWWCRVPQDHERVPASEVHVLSPEREWALSYKWVAVEAA